MTPSWAGARFRASDRFELRRLDELTPAQREPFLELQEDADFHGLLVPRAPGEADVKSVSRDGAALFQSLATPSHVDAGLVDDDLVDLVLDGVLEIEEEGNFLWGADALSVFGHSVGIEDDPRHVARLSIDALQHAADLESADAATLTTALYFYNRIPMSPFWRSRFGDPQAVIAHLGADSPASPLASGWHMTLPSPQSPGWISWHTNGARLARDAAMYKLYVSPRPENIRDAFEIAVRLFAENGGVDFKIGCDAYGLLRPDKLVAYFRSRKQLDVIASALRPRLDGCPSHGVPFTAAIDDGGILSWGLDPPESARALRWLGRESWRLWLATKLGSAVATAKRSSSRRSVEPWKFALERVRRLGVNVDVWAPADALWSEA
jgi:hypothetical protein